MMVKAEGIRTTGELRAKAMAAGRAARVSDLSMVVIYKDGWGRVERCDDGKKRNQELCRVLSLPPTNGSGTTVSICGLALGPNCRRNAAVP